MQVVRIHSIWYYCVGTMVKEVYGTCVPITEYGTRAYVFVSGLYGSRARMYLKHEICEQL